MAIPPTSNGPRPNRKPHLSVACGNGRRITRVGPARVEGSSADWSGTFFPGCRTHFRHAIGRWSRGQYPTPGLMFSIVPNRTTREQRCFQARSIRDSFTSTSLGENRLESLTHRKGENLPPNSSENFCKSWSLTRAGPCLPKFSCQMIFTKGRQRPTRRIS